MSMSISRESSSLSKGFTFIELLVVIAILGLLVGILMPSLLMAKHKAKTVLCLASLKCNGLALALYETENDSCYPETMKYKGDFVHHKMWWSILLHSRHLETTKTLWCPESTIQKTITIDARLDSSWLPHAFNHGTIGVLTSWWGGTSRRLSYPSGADESIPFRPSIFVRDRSHEAFLLDSVGRFHANPTYDEAASHLGTGGYGEPADYRAYGVVDAQEPIVWRNLRWSGLSIRHGYRTNVLYFDGHADNVAGKDLWYQEYRSEECIWDGY